MSGTNLLSSVSVLFTLLSVGLLGLAFYLAYRLACRLLVTLDRLQGDQRTLMAEYLAHRTYAETGNQAFAGQMLAHSNAHGLRTEMPPIYTPPDNSTEVVGPHEEQPVFLGMADDELEKPE